MKLIALKRFSSKVQKGDSFEVPDRDGRVLVAAGVARPEDEAENKPRRGRGYRTRRMQAESN